MHFSASQAAVNASLEAAHHFFIRDGRVFCRCADLGRKGDVDLGSVDTEGGTAELSAPSDIKWDGLSGGSLILESQDRSDCRTWLEAQGFQVSDG